MSSRPDEREQVGVEHIRMEAVNHCILSRADLRVFSKRDGYDQRLLIPADGETLAI